MNSLLENFASTSKRVKELPDTKHQFLSKTLENEMITSKSTCLDLQMELLLFNIIFYMERGGRENLRIMKKDTFTVEQNSDGLHYIYQKKDEADKNQDEKDTENSNQSRIYGVPGTSTSDF